MPRILVVDDTPKAREHLAAAAHLPGTEVVTAGSAKEAVQKIADETFAVVVTDLKMETNEAGLEVLKAAKKKDAYTQVIVITAYGTPEVGVRTMSLGGFDYLEKNFPGTDVFGMVRNKVNQALEFRNAKLKEIGVQ
jgi:DNA-binding NtrC family response regulator